MIGQELTRRLHGKTEWPGLYACGDSTTMGMGTPAVIASGFGAANVILRELGKKEFHSQNFEKEYVKYIKNNPAPRRPARIDGDPENARLIARECQYCENQPCRAQCPARIDIAGFIRRIEAGNYLAAARLIRETNPLPEICGYLCHSEQLCEKACVRTKYASEPVQIRELHKWVAEHAGKEGWSPPVAQPNGHKMCVVGCGVDGLTCSHYLSRLGYTIDLLDEASDYTKTEIFANEDLPDNVKRRELSGILFPSITYKGNMNIKNRDQLAELSSNYIAVYVSKQLEERRLENGFDKGLKNVLFGTAYLAETENKARIESAVENGRRVATTLDSFLQRKRNECALKN
jgi:hypothetical protein